MVIKEVPRVSQNNQRSLGKPSPTTILFFRATRYCGQASAGRRALITHTDPSRKPCMSAETSFLGRAAAAKLRSACTQPLRAADKKSLVAFSLALRSMSCQGVKFHLPAAIAKLYTGHPTHADCLLQHISPLPWGPHFGGSGLTGKGTCRC